MTAASAPTKRPLDKLPSQFRPFGIAVHTLLNLASCRLFCAGMRLFMPSRHYSKFTRSHQRAPIGG
jgi:hypothetical protein